MIATSRRRSWCLAVFARAFVSHHLRSRSRPTVLTLALALTTMLAFPLSTRAAKYTVWACADEGGRPLASGDWRPHRVNGDRHQMRSCDDVVEGMAPYMFARADPALGNQPASSGAGWRVAAAAGTAITSLDLWWNNCVSSLTGPPGRIEVYAGATSIYRRDGHSCWGVSGGPVAGESPHGNHQSFGSLTASTVTLFAWCLSSCDGSTGALLWAADFYAYRLKLIIDDPHFPAGTAHGLADGMRVHGSAPLQVQAEDLGAGVREISLLVDGGVVDRVSSEGGDCSDVDPHNGDSLEYNHVQPCPRLRIANLALAPIHLADGSRHTVSVLVTDAAGQSTSISNARVALAAPPGYFSGGTFFNPDLDVVTDRKFNGAGAGATDARLSFVVGKAKRNGSVRARVLGAIDRPVIQGQLMSARGPIAGARVWVATALAKGLWQISERPITTSATGVVRGRLPPRAPSREARLVYFPYSDSSEYVESPSRRIIVRGATTIRTDHGGYSNGDTMRFSGRISTLPVPRRHPVYLQTIVRGRWRTFGTTRANARGHWTMTYRFTATRRLTRYRFRAVVPATDLPVSWATGYSRPVRVIVAP